MILFETLGEHYLLYILVSTCVKGCFYQLDQWGETYCDRTVCEYLPDVKGLFSTIIDISMEEIRYIDIQQRGYMSKEY